MTRLMVTISFCSILLPTAAMAAEASPSSVSGSTALALAGVVAPLSPTLSAADKQAVAAFFNGDTSEHAGKPIKVTADKIVCRTSNVDITARSCEVSFGSTTTTLRGRAANELFATEVAAGVPSDGAAGSNFESLAKLLCTLDPAALKDKGGAGASCVYGPAD